jgi:hypothetical protein
LKQQIHKLASRWWSKLPQPTLCSHFDFVLAHCAETRGQRCAEAANKFSPRSSLVSEDAPHEETDSD